MPRSVPRIYINYIGIILLLLLCYNLFYFMCTFLILFIGVVFKDIFHACKYKAIKFKLQCEYE